MHSVEEGLLLGAAEVGEDCGGKVVFDDQLVGPWQPLRQLFQWTGGNQNEVVLLGNTRVVKEGGERTFQGDSTVGQEEAHYRKGEKYFMSISSNSHESSSKNTDIY